MRRSILAATLALGATGICATGAAAEPEAFTLDPAHSQAMFSYKHLGFSTTYGIFSGFEGEIMFDAEDPANSSVEASIPLMSMFTGWDERKEHFMSDEFFDAAEGDMITFTSTDIEVTGENTAKITGDLTIAGVTQSVVLDTTLNKQATHPMENRPWMGLDATTTLKRTDYDVGNYVPIVSDEVEVHISVEAGKAGGDS